jgi:hypothetical protein
VPEGYQQLLAILNVWLAENNSSTRFWYVVSSIGIQCYVSQRPVLKSEKVSTLCTLNIGVDTLSLTLFVRPLENVTRINEVWRRF